MTAKEALHEKVSEMTEEEALELLQRLDWESTEFDELTPEELAEVEEGERQIAEGEYVTLEELEAELDF